MADPEKWGPFGISRGEPLVVWVGRSMALLRSEIDTLILGGAEIERIRIRVPRLFLELVHSVVYERSLGEAAVGVESEEKAGALHLLGVAVELVSGAPEVLVSTSRIGPELKTQPLSPPRRFGGS